jgi:predicted CoA-substrate-specific enzyme activase
MVLGIDVGSTFTKYVVMDSHEEFTRNEKFKTPANQREFFEHFIRDMKKEFPIDHVAACGYGRKNVPADRVLSDLTALAAGVKRIDADKNIHLLIDIGGQDTKVLALENGQLKNFVLNDKCAAGAGMYIKMAVDILDIDFSQLEDLLSGFENIKSMSTLCAVYAQTEIVGRISRGEPHREIITAAVDFVLKQLKPMVSQVAAREKGIFTGGLSPIEPIRQRISQLLGFPVFVPPYSEFLAAYGAAGYNH